MSSGFEASAGGSRAVPGREPGWRFGEPTAGDRRSWVVPPGHGIWEGMNLELLDPGDEEELGFLIEALHESGDLPWSGSEPAPPGQAGSPRLHVAMHQIVARQILADDPPQAWQAVQRLALLDYRWHDIMHMIAGLVAQDVQQALAGQHPDPAGYIRRLDDLPAGWPKLPT